MSVRQLSQWWSAAPAAMANLADSKGSIAPGFDADLLVFRPDLLADTTGTGLHHKHKESPYAGMSLEGRVVATFVGGAQVFEGSLGPSEALCGHLVGRRGTAHRAPGRGAAQASEL
jgi:allantoinase